MIRATDGKYAVLVFAKEPRPGAVKTRLIPDIGASAAAKVYRHLLDQALKSAAAIPVDSRYLYANEAPVDGLLTERSTTLGFQVRLQQGDGLGQRMYQATSETLATHAAVVLIGSDCPEYTPAYLQSALNALAGHDVVIGPAHDGGYVLLAARRVEAALFADIDWSTPAVLAQTRQRLRSLAWTWTELAPLHDVDDARGLARFPALVEAAGKTIASPITEPLTRALGEP